MTLPTGAKLLLGKSRERAIDVLRNNHYTRSVSSGKTYYFQCGKAIVGFSIPPNRNIAKFVLGRESQVWELSRLWAPDGHERNLLTRAISLSVLEFRRVEPAAEALVAYADPNAGHSGHVYAAASWVYAGQSGESRCYVGADGRPVARRKFHSGHAFIRKAGIEALGYKEVKLPGKLRFVRGLTPKAKRYIRSRWHGRRPAATVRELVLSRRRSYEVEDKPC